MTYSSTLAAGRQKYTPMQRNNVSFKAKARGFGPVSNTLILIVLVLLLGLVYLTQVTKTNSYGYRINELNNYRTQLKEQHEQLEVAAARQQALERVQASPEVQKLISTTPSGTVQD